MLILLGYLFQVLSPAIDTLGQMYYALLVHSDHEGSAG